MIPYTVKFTNGDETIIYARDGRDAWQVACARAATTYRAVDTVTL
jgi:hypothetical protein